MPESPYPSNHSQGGDRSAAVLDISDQSSLMAARKNNEPLSVQTGQGTSSISGSQTSSPMRHDKKHPQSAPITVGMPASSNAVTMVGHAPMAVTMGVQGQIGAIPPEFIPRVGMHYDGQQQQGYMQQQHVGHPPYQSYVPYPGNNQAYIHSGYHPQMVRPAPQQHYQPHQGPGHEMTVMHQQQQHQQHNLVRGRIDERAPENYAGTYNGNNRMMTGYPYRNMSASISDYPYDATYATNQQGGQLTGFYAPMPVQVGMVDGGGVPIPGGIITVAGPMNMGPEHERLLVLAKGNDQHKQATDMLLKAAQSEVTTTRKRCEELTQQIEDLKKQLEDVKLENEAYKAAASEAKIAADTKVELDAAELLKEKKEAALALVQKNLAASSIANGAGFDGQSTADSSSTVNAKDTTSDMAQGRHGTDQAATSLVKSVLLSPQHHSAATSPNAAGMKSAAKVQKPLVGEDDDDDDDEASSDRPTQGRVFRGGVQGQSRSRSNSNLDNNSKGLGKVREPDQFQRGPRTPGSYNAFDKGRERDSYDSSAVPSFSGFGQGQGRGGGRGGQGMPMRAHNVNQSDARGGPGGGGGNGVRPLRPTRIILPPGTGGPQGVHSPGASGSGPRLEDSATVDQGQVNNAETPGTKGEGAMRGDIKKGPTVPSYDSAKKGNITSPPPLGNRTQGNGRPFGSSPYIPRDYSAPRDIQDSDPGSPGQRKSPTGQFYSNSPDEHARNAGGGTWRDQTRKEPVRERKPGDDRFDNNAGRGNSERRVELAKVKKPIKITKSDKLHPEREGRADGAGTKGDTSRGADDDDDEKRVVASQAPEDNRDSSRDNSNAPTSAFAGGDYPVEDTGRTASSSSAATGSPMHQGAPSGAETRSNASSVVCRFYAKGLCIFGAKCQNIHSGSGGNRPPLNRPPTTGNEDGTEIEDDQDGGAGRGDRVEKRAGRGKERPGRDGGREMSGRGRGGRGVKRGPFPAPSTSPSNGGAHMSPSPWTEDSAPTPAPAPASDASTSVSVSAAPSASDTPHDP